VPKNYNNRLGAWKNDVSQTKKLRRYTGKELPEWNQNILPQWYDRVEAEGYDGPTEEILNREAPVTGKLPDEDIDEVPLSLFLDYQKKEDVAWEFFLDELRFSQKVCQLSDILVPFNCTMGRLYAVTKFGAVAVGWITDDTTAGHLRVYWNRGISFYTGAYGLANEQELNLYPEIWMSPDHLDDMISVTLDWYLYRRFYAQEPSNEFYPMNYVMSTDVTIDEGTETDATYRIFRRWQTRVQRACEIYGLFGSKKYSRFSMSSKLDPSKLVAAAREEAEYEYNNRSEAAWPQLPGFNTQYLDNVGIFVPVNYVVDQNLTYLVRQAAAQSGQFTPDALSKFAVLRKGGYGNLQDYQTREVAGMLGGSVPFVGQYIRLGTTLADYSNVTQANMFWPCVYAFGRNDVGYGTYESVAPIHQWYYSNIQTSGKGPTILNVDGNLFATLMALLLSKGYVPSPTGNLAGGVAPPFGAMGRRDTRTRPSIDAGDTGYGGERF